MTMPIYSAEFRRQLMEVFLRGKNNTMIRATGLRMHLALSRSGAQVTFFAVDEEGENSSNSAVWTTCSTARP